MADNNIALGVQVPDSFKTISGMMNFAGQAQQLQSARQDYQRGGIALEKERGLLQPSIRAGEAAADTAQTGAKAAAFKLEGDQAAVALNEAAGLFKDPRIINSDPDGTVQALMEAKQRMIDRGVPPAKAEWQTAQLISRAHTPGAVYQGLQNIIQSNAGPQAQAGVVNAPLQAISTGGAVQPTQLQPGAPGGTGPVGNAMPLTLGPGSVETTETGPDRQQYIVTRSPQGTILSTRSLAGGPAGGTGAAGGMPKFNPGDAEEIPALMQHRVDARTALANAPDLHQNNRGILGEIDKVTTGAAGPTLQKLFSTLGAAFSTPEERASAYDLLGKYQERNVIQTAQSMGPHTNSGLESVRAANGSTAYNPSAIKKITKLVDANITGTEAYQPGLEKAIAADPQRGVLAIREYQQAWGQNYDPRITLLSNAKRSGDKAEYDDVMRTLSAADKAMLATKARNLDKLSRDGRL